MHCINCQLENLILATNGKAPISLAFTRVMDKKMPKSTYQEQTADDSLLQLQPLHLLAGMESPGAYELLLEHLSRGADPNHRNEDGLTPLHVAAAWGRFEALKLLLCNGGDPMIRDAEGQNALEMALEEGHNSCVKLLLWWCDHLGVESIRRAVDKGLHSQLDAIAKDWSARSEPNQGPQSPFSSRPLDFCSSFKRLSVERVRRSNSLQRASAQMEKAHGLREKVKLKEKSMKRAVDSHILTRCTQMDNKELRIALVKEGVDVGPITSTTRKAYELKLAAELTEREHGTNLKFSQELEELINNQWSTREATADLDQLVDTFNEPNRKWRQGTAKESFCYFLLDPNVSQNLPCRKKLLGKSECLRIFCSSIFYVGKGKRQRPLQHLIDAARQKQVGSGVEGDKLKRIAQLWDQNCAVVSFHVWHSVIAAEAYTREAAVIEALQLKNLTNKRRGEYYGPATTWSPSRRRRLGALLLQRAMQIFLLEGERHFRPEDVS